MSRDRCARALALRVGDVLSVGKTRWLVERAHGVTSYVVKQGSKGRKLYSPTVTEIDPQCCIEVREVWPGSGDPMPGVKPAARGCLVGDGGVFAGATRGRARRRR
jgi:hypothetical protein